MYYSRDSHIYFETMNPQVAEALAKINDCLLLSFAARVDGLYTF